MSLYTSKEEVFEKVYEKYIKCSLTFPTRGEFEKFFEKIFHKETSLRNVQMKLKLIELLRKNSEKQKDLRLM